MKPLFEYLLGKNKKLQHNVEIGMSKKDFISYLNKNNFTMISQDAIFDPDDKIDEYKVYDYVIGVYKHTKKRFFLIYFEHDAISNVMYRGISGKNSYDTDIDDFIYYIEE